MKTNEPGTDPFRRPTGGIRWRTALTERSLARIGALSRRRIGAVLLALVVGVVTGSIVSAAERTRHRWDPSTSMLVATDSIGAGDAVNATNTARRLLPLALAPGRPLTRLVEPTYAAGPIVPGQVLSEAHIALDRFGLTTSSRSVTLPMPLAPPDVLAGDRVDLFSVRSAPGAVDIDLITSAAIIVAIGPDGVTVNVDARVVPALFESLAVGSVEVARRPAQG